MMADTYSQSWIRNVVEFWGNCNGLFQINHYPQINNYRKTQINIFRMISGVKNLRRKEETYWNESTDSSLNRRRNQSEVSAQFKHEESKL
jgi:hypothetical protein